jgi:hypothetical protein
MAGLGRRGCDSVLLCKADGLLDALGVGKRGLVIVVVPGPTAGDDKDTEEGE